MKLEIDLPDELARKLAYQSSQFGMGMDTVVVQVMKGFIGKTDFCDWHLEGESSDNLWLSACEYTYWFETDGPLGNAFIFCPSCGRIIREVTELETEDLEQQNPNIQPEPNKNPLEI